MTLIKAGNKVRFLNEVGGGVVTRVVDSKFVNVLTQDGFEMPVLIKELVRVDADIIEKSKDETSSPLYTKQVTLAENSGEYEANPEINLLFAFVSPQEIFKLSKTEVYLINDSNYECYYLVSLQSDDKMKYIASGILESNTKIIIDEFDIVQLFNYEYIEVQQILFNTNEFKHQPPVVKLINAKDITILKNRDFVENDYFDESAYILEMTPGTNIKQATTSVKEDLGKMLKEKMMEKNKEPEKDETPEKSNGIEECDLHIHEIMENYQGLSNGEIVRIQLDRFETVLEGAIINKTKKIVFIHGVGNGSLKLELRKKLDNKYPDVKYQDASFKEYGYGATMVYLNK